MIRCVTGQAWELIAPLRRRGREGGIGLAGSWLLKRILLREGRSDS